jgi:murein endopeptidase
MAETAEDRLRPPQDARGYFMLPQAPEDSGYYVYGRLDGRPSRGAYQYAPPVMMMAILRVAREWQALDKRRFGVGDISRAGGLPHKDHSSHLSGLEVDIRPLRKDGRHESVTWHDSQYDRAATAKLIELFRIFAPVNLVFFNDPEIPFVRMAVHHDDHFHVKLRG